MVSTILVLQGLLLSSILWTCEPLEELDCAFSLIGCDDIEGVLGSILTILKCSDFFKLILLAEVDDRSLSAFLCVEHKQIADKSCVVIVF